MINNYSYRIRYQSFMKYILKHLNLLIQLSHQYLNNYMIRKYLPS